MTSRIGSAVLAALITSALLTGGCGEDDRTSSRLLENSQEGRLTIGITFDQPGLGQKLPDNTVRGFDVDVARYIATELGVRSEKILWKQVLLADRETEIDSGAVDFVAAAYSITEERKRRVTFAGPYFVAGQDLLVRYHEPDVKGPEDLAGRRLCTVEKTTSAVKIQREYAATVQLVEYARFEMCLSALLAFEVDAVTTDDLILAGYAAKNPELLRLVGKKFSEERYGIGLKKGDETGRSRIEDAIRKMIDTGTWAQSLSRNFPDTDFESNPPSPVGQP